MAKRAYLIAGALSIAAVSTLAIAKSHTEGALRVSPALMAAVAAPTRTPANVERDKYRNPGATLAFFGVKPTDTVVELIPSAGWYTEILGPYLAQRGTLYAAQSPGAGQDRLKAKLAASPVYAKVKVVPLMGAGIAPNSVDAVLTFRNIHNLTMRGDGTDAKLLAEAYAMLKPGGTLGIEEHRLPESRDVAAEKTSGYLKVSSVRRIVEAAGFRYIGSSEVNANPRDTADYPKGVWTLPPNFREGDVDRAKYAAIGESDRMTLKFVKPKR